MNNKKEEDTKVSICCAAYNQEKYIRKTLEGFVKQKTNFCFEILIHDDASTDNTGNIIREYEKQYPDIIKAIYQKENQYSKNVDILKRYQLSRAKGKYIAFCEGDDYWCDEFKLQKQFDVMELHPECTMCTHIVQCVNEDGSHNDRAIPEPRYSLSGGGTGIISETKMAKMLWEEGGYPFHTSSYFIRSKILEEYLNGNLPYANYFNGDQLLMRNALSKGLIYYINSVMSCRRLWSVGNWNTRFLKLSQDEKKKFYLKNVIGEVLYDKYTEYKYQNFIKTCVAYSLYDLGICEDQEIKTAIGEQYLTKKELLSKVPLSRKVKHFIKLKMPNLYRFLKNMKNR